MLVCSEPEFPIEGVLKYKQVKSIRKLANFIHALNTEMRLRHFCVRDTVWNGFIGFLTASLSTLVSILNSSMV